MTQPLRQNVAIWIVVICVLEAGPHLFHLFPFSILHLAKALTTQRARKTQCDFGCECHPHLQRLGNTKRARLLEVNVDQWRCYGQFHFLFNRLTAQRIPQGRGGTPSMNITLLSSLQTALLSKLFDHTRIHPQTMNSSHMLLTRKLCWLIVMTLSNEKKRRNREAKRAFFK